MELPAAALAEVLGRLEARGATAAEIASPGDRAGLVLALENVHDWPLLRAALLGVAGVTVADEGIGALSVVGTGLSAGHRVLREVTAALDGLGAPPRALFTSALRVTAYTRTTSLADAAREVHRRLVG